MPKTVYHIHLTCPTFLNKGISKGFMANGYTVIEIDWQKVKTTLGIQRLRAKIVEDVNGLKPDFVFAQVQSKGILDVDTVQEIMKVAPLVMFDVDARTTENSEWMYQLVPHITHYFFSNGNDVKQCNNRGIFNVSVLQSSVDLDEYYPVSGFKECGQINGSKIKCAIKVPDVIFIGNKTIKYPNSKQRTDMVFVLQKEFGNRFGVFGLGWGEEGFIGPGREREIYSNCKVSVLHNNFSYPQYESDRLWRSYFSGAMTIHYTQDYDYIENIKWYLDNHERLKSRLDQVRKVELPMCTYAARVRTMEDVLESNYGLKF